MTITSTTATRIDELVQVAVVSDLTGTVYYHWYVDGVWRGMTSTPTHTIYVGSDAQARIDVVDTNDADFDYLAGNPSPYPAARRLWWIRSLAGDVDHYRIEQQIDGGDWTALAAVPRRGEQWHYEYTTGRLTDLTAYVWRVVPVDEAGNDGTAVTLDAETIVRVPDAPEFTATFDPDTETVAFAAA